MNCRQFEPETTPEFVGEVHRLSVENGREVHACFLLEVLRGITQATREVPDARKMLFCFFENLLQPLLTMLARFEDDETFTCSILKLGAELIDVHILFLKVQQACILVSRERTFM